VRTWDLALDTIFYADGHQQTYKLHQQQKRIWQYKFCVGSWFYSKLLTFLIEIQNLIDISVLNFFFNNCTGQTLGIFQTYFDKEF
jgi:hypothetical protein